MLVFRERVKGFFALFVFLILIFGTTALHAGFPNPYDGLWLGSDMSLSDDYNGIAHSAWANLGVKLTGRYSGSPPVGSFMYVVEHLGSGLLKSNAMANYVDVIVRKFLDGDKSTEIQYDKDGDFHYISGYEAKALIDRQCLDVMVQTICFSMYLSDVNHDGKIFTYDPANTNTYVHFRASTGSDGTERTKDDYIYLEISFANVGLDVLIEPPLNSELDPSESLNYLCSDQISGHPIYGCIPADSNDPSKPANSDDVPRVLDYYVKAWTIAQVNQIKVKVGIQLQSVFYPDQDERSKIGFNLEDIEIDGDFQMILHAGPFCDDSGGDTLGHAVPTDNENDCYYSNGYRYPDATHNATTFMTELIPFINAELKATAKDIWQDDTPGTPGYYFGPTMLIDLSDITKNLALSNPIYPNPNSITVELSMRTSDSIPHKGGSTDSYADFWTDYYGTLTVFDLGIRSKFLDADTGSPVHSCMQDSGSLSGYVDGWGYWRPTIPPQYIDNTSDDITGILTSTNQSVQFKNGYGGYTTSSSAIRNATRGLLWYERMPVLPGPGDVKTYSDIYSIGIALHQNLLNKLLYDLVTNGVLCLDLDARNSGGSGGGMGLDLSSILNTKFFKYIFPALADRYPDADMRVRGYPALKDFTNGGHTPAPSELGNLPDWQMPYFVVGGPKIRTQNFEFIPDLTLVIPNYLLQFYVYDDNAGGILRRAFGINTTLVIGLHIDLLKTSDPSVTLPSGFTYNGTWYPIGCDSDGDTSDCDVQADTLRVLRIAGMVHPFVNAVLTYEEMDDYTNANAFENVNYYINGISQIIGVLLSSRLDLDVDIGFDPGAFLGMPLSLNFVKIGPSFVADNGTTNLTDGDGNGYGDYLEIGIKIEDYFGNDPNLIGKYILRLLDKFMSGGLGGGLSLGGAPASEGIPGVSWKYDPTAKPLLGFTDFFDEPEVVPSKLGVVIPVKSDFPESYEISYKLDEGLWTPFFRPDSELKFYNLPEGWHRLEISFMGPGAKDLIRNNITYKFLADYTPPSINKIDVRNGHNEVEVSVRATDNFTPSEALKVQYKVDSGEWRDGDIPEFRFSLRKEGVHVLKLKVTDSEGNVAYAVKRFVYSSSFGCTQSGSSADYLVILLIPLILVVVRRGVRT